MLYFCTLYYSNYAAKGLTMYRSLKKVCPEFHLFVFAFDDKLVALLKKMTLPEVTVVSLAEFEDPELLRVKSSRTVAEYCWTCTASTILYCLNHFDIDHCTYLDSDLFFYQNPQVMLDEMGNNDILITPHWFDPDEDISDIKGKYCVQFVTARNNSNGKRIINDWREECIDWCSSHFENGKLGDQMYLDKWPVVYNGVVVSSNMGGGVAPWNMTRYDYNSKDEVIWATERKMGITFPIVFFHFHFVFPYRVFFFRKFSFDRYSPNEQVSQTVFSPYCEELKESYREIKRLGLTDVELGIQKDDSSWKEVVKQWIRRIKRVDYNHYWWI